MQKQYTFKIDRTIFDLFDDTIKNFGYKRSPAIAALMKNFNCDICVNLEEKKRFILANAKAIEGYGNETKTATIVLEEELLNMYLESIKPLKQKDALEKLMVNFLNLPLEEKTQIILG